MSRSGSITVFDPSTVAYTHEPHYRKKLIPSLAIAHVPQSIIQYDHAVLFLNSGILCNYPTPNLKTVNVILVTHSGQCCSNRILLHNFVLSIILAHYNDYTHYLESRKELD